MGGKTQAVKGADLLSSCRYPERYPSAFLVKRDAEKVCKVLKTSATLAGLEPPTFGLGS
jgi:hypothetical protein